MIEVKTELADLGGLERQLGWYSREARRAVRGLGWNPTEVVPVALLLSTEVNDDRVRANATSIGQTFPGRWRDLMATVKGAGGESRGWAIALIDPRSRVRDWCRPTVLDGRRSAAPYRNIADFLRAVR